MKLQKIPMIIILLMVIIGGGWLIISYSATHCLEIHAHKDMFYGKFASELRKAMQDYGYNLSCPTFMPKTTIDFVYTGKKYHHTKTPQSPLGQSIALVGDCYTAYNIDLLKQYDYLIVVSETRFGYLAMFNFKAIHFPLTDVFSTKFCATDYDSQNIDIISNVQYLDDIIKRGWHDK